MALIGPEGAIQELPVAWRRAAYAALFAVSLTAAYFMFVSGPLADAKEGVRASQEKIAGVEQEVSGMKTDITTIKMNQARTDQKLDDVKDSMGAINQKLDRLLNRGHSDP